MSESNVRMGHGRECVSAVFFSGMVAGVGANRIFRGIKCLDAKDSRWRQARNQKKGEYVGARPTMRFAMLGSGYPERENVVSCFSTLESPALAQSLSYCADTPCELTSMTDALWRSKLGWDDRKLKE